MRSGLATLGVLAVSACTRVNPAYDGGDAEGVSSGTEGTTDRPSTETGADVTSTGADMTETGADVTETGTDAGACMSGHAELAPEKDAFLVWCEGGLCAENNFGLTEVSPIEDGDLYRAHLLMSFDTSKVVTGAENGLVAKLSLSVQNAAAISVMAYQTPPMEWAEGMGNDQTALEGEATWSWSSNPTQWTVQGTPLEGYGAIVPISSHFTPLAVGGFGTPRRIEIPVPQQIVNGWIAEPGIVHIGVTATGADAFAGSRESSEPPLLVVDGC